jgi:Flp pilus assembly protein TadB
MSSYDQEQERLKRLRDRQIADRDPTVKKRQFHRQSVERERRAYRSLTFKDIWTDIPHIWKGLFYALVFGLVGMFIITSLWISIWAWIVSGVLLFFFLIIGLVVGRAADSRDEIKEHLR